MFFLFRLKILFGLIYCGPFFIGFLTYFGSLKTHNFDAPLRTVWLVIFLVWYYEKNVAIGFFWVALENFFTFSRNLFSFFLKTAIDFHKRGFNGTSDNYPVCLRNFLDFLKFAPLSTAFENVCEENFWPVFFCFLHFLENCTLNSEILIALKRTDCKNSPA